MVRDKKEQIRKLKAAARRDPEYGRLCNLGLVLERKFEAALMDLPDGVQDAVWRYLFHCEARVNAFWNWPWTKNKPGAWLRAFV